MDFLDRIEHKTISVLDRGYVQLVDCMPRLGEANETCDHSIVDAARVSYQLGTQRKSSDEQLIRYLMRHHHTSPLEQVIFKFEIKMPLFVFAQHVRHRTASINAESGRYSVIKDEFYEPFQLRAQIGSNKQATLDIDPFGDPLTVSKEASNMIMHNQNAYKLYQDLLDSSVCREQARMTLPTSIYTSHVWTMDLLNLLKYLHLRMDRHAQYETRVYANAVASFVEQLCPWTYKAFKDYWVDSMSLSQSETLYIKTKDDSLLSKGELVEFQTKIGSMDIQIA